MAYCFDTDTLQHIHERALSLLREATGLPDTLRSLHEATLRKAFVDPQGFVPPVALVYHLNHEARDRPLLDALAVACACFFCAADLADDCEDEELVSAIWAEWDRGVAINTATGLLFLAYQAIGRIPTDGETMLALIREITRGGWEMHIGQHQDLVATNTIREADAREIARRKAGAEYATFLASGALVLGLCPEPYRALGEALGALSQVQSDVTDVWLKGFSSDLAAGKASWPIVAALGTHDPELRHLFAGDRRLDVRQRELRRALCRPELIASWRWEIGYWKEAMDAALRRIPAEAGLRALSQQVHTRALQIANALFAASQKMSSKGAPDARATSGSALDRALDWLCADAVSREAWDIHRWGAFDKQIVVGDVFPVAYVGEALALCQRAQPGRAELLLSRIDADGWRYFPGEASIPPDADDFGQIVCCLRAMGIQPGALRQKLAPALDYLLCCVGNGHLPVWWYASDEDRAENRWDGEGCPGAIASGLRGLVALEQPELLSLIGGTVELLLQAQGQDGLWRGFHYPEPWYCTFLVALALSEASGWLPTALQSAVHKALAPLPQRLSAAQRLDGSWGSPMATAAAILTWIALDPAAPGALSAVRFLEDTQEPDGGWPPEVAYPGIGVGYVKKDIKNRSFPTAISARALAACRSARLLNIGA